MLSGNVFIYGIKGTRQILLKYLLERKKKKMIGDKGFKLYIENCPPSLTLINIKEGLSLFLPVFVLIDYNFISMALIFLNFGVSSFAFLQSYKEK